MILGLDVGDKRVGLALSDEKEKFSYPQGTLLRAGGKAEKEILRLIEDKQIKTLVVGMPLGEHHESNEQCKKIESFARRISKRSQVKLKFVDEYGTSEEAMELLRNRGMREKKMKEKGVIDALSASIILQTYIDSL